MSLLVEKYQQLETALGEYLENLNAKPPLGFGTFLKPLNQSFQLCRIQGRLIQDQAKKLDELEKQLAALAPQATEAATDDK